jgi:molybdate-binding protein
MGKKKVIIHVWSERTYCYMICVARKWLNKQVLLGNGYARNNGRTVGSGVFFVVRAEAI